MTTETIAPAEVETCCIAGSDVTFAADLVLVPLYREFGCNLYEAWLSEQEAAYTSFVENLTGLHVAIVDEVEIT